MNRSHLHKAALSAAVCAALLAAPLQSAFAWGKCGHQAVAIVAQKYLQQHDPATLKQALDILAWDADGDIKAVPFADVAVCADNVRRGEQNAKVECGGEDLHVKNESQPWHFINLVIGTKYPENAKLETNAQGGTCPGKHCVTGEIRWAVHALQDPKSNAELKQEAMIFLIHMVGDIHQPLHCGSEIDDNGKSNFGGNGVKITRWGSLRPDSFSLHSLWDNVVAFRDNCSPSTLADEALAGLAGVDTSGWNVNDLHAQVEKIARESYNIANEIVYPAYHEVQPKKGGAYEIVDPNAYQAKMQPIAKKRIQEAGVRLAHLIRMGLHPLNQTRPGQPGTDRGNRSK
ncbi:MAG: S1/P1 nuclease [Elusimicrobia bacterium]|nr:S1/P1 nuclease [Elusimicrobiota bacterium]